MHLSQIVLYLSLLIALGPVVLSDQETHQQPSATSPGDTEQCATCEVRQQIKTMRLNAIKSQILSKLRMKEAPNISRDIVKQLLPKAPPLQQLLDQYDVLGDDNRDVVMEEDDEHAITETIMMMATERKFLFRFGLVKRTRSGVSKIGFYARDRAHGRGYRCSFFEQLVALTGYDHENVEIQTLPRFKLYMGPCIVADSALILEFLTFISPLYSSNVSYLFHFISHCSFHSHISINPFLSPSLSSRVHRPSGWGTKVLLLLFHSKVSSQSYSPGSALGASAPGGGGDHCVPADLPPDAGHRREQAHTHPLPEDRRECRGQLLAKYRRQTSVDCVAAAAGDQLGHRD